jgi:hypothetical protein
MIVGMIAAVVRRRKDTQGINSQGPNMAREAPTKVSRRWLVQSDSSRENFSRVKVKILTGDDRLAPESEGG